MSSVRVLVGTKKGAFVLTADGKRQNWTVNGPHFPGWEMYHLKGSPAEPSRLYASQSSGWFGQVMQRSNDGGVTWEPVDNKFAYDGVPGTHQWYDGTPHPWEFKRVWHLEPSLTDPDTVYAGVEDAAMFRTTDGGKSWQPWQAHVPNPKSLHLYGMRAAGTALYLVGEQGTLLRSTDGGASFEAVASPYKGSYFGLVTARSGEIVVFGLRGTAFWSGDQGRSWQAVDTGLQQAITAGIELADGTLALLSQGGELLLSDDRGRSFARQPNAQPWPSAALVQAADKSLVVAGLRGVRRQQPLIK